MAAPLLLLQVLERTEITKLPKGLQNKLEKFLSDRQYEIDSLRAHQEQFRVDSEQQFFDKTKQLEKSQEELLTQAQESQKLKEDFSKHDDVRQLNDKLVETSASKMGLKIKLDELEAAEVNIKYREKRMEQEKELLHTQTTWLNGELKSKSEELLSLSRQKGNEILELKCSLENKEDEACSIDRVVGLKASNEHAQKHVEDLINKLKEGAAADAETKSEELSGAVEELHKLLKEAGEASEAQEQKLQGMKGAQDMTVAELQQRIQSLEKELGNANELLSDSKQRGPPGSSSLLSEEQITTMSPTAAAVAKIKPGMKLTELYTAYVESQEQLQLERLENKRTNKYLDDIVQEVEAKAPLLKRQREEHERMQKSVASLSAKLEQAVKEVHRLQKEADEANKRSSVSERGQPAL
ncbi:hypothetical protein CRUP_024242 [Coryphaenoides rupestris]|nr:hypothetical protein CRUP_024242 [Coryphaenoides rupestris]